MNENPSNTHRPVALITGASSGIGKSLAFVAASKGYNLTLTARSTETLEEIKQLIESRYSVEILCVSGDISNEAFCCELFDLHTTRFKQLNLLINNAGISMRGLLLETDLTVIKRVMDVNFWGSVYCTKFALPLLLKSQGSIIGVSSIAGFKGLPARAGYSASKFALQGFLESVRNENRKNQLHVLIACPGYTESNIRKAALNANGQQQAETPLNESSLMSSDEVALKIWKAYERRSWYLILTLQGKLAVWINTFFPKLADWLTYRVISKEPNSPFK